MIFFPLMNLVEVEVRLILGLPPACPPLKDVEKDVKLPATGALLNISSKPNPKPKPNGLNNCELMVLLWPGCECLFRDPGKIKNNFSRNYKQKLF